MAKKKIKDEGAPFAAKPIAAPDAVQAALTALFVQRSRLCLTKCHIEEGKTEAALELNAEALYYHAEVVMALELIQDHLTELEAQRQAMLLTLSREYHAIKNMPPFAGMKST